MVLFVTNNSTFNVGTSYYVAIAIKIDVQLLSVAVALCGQECFVFGFVQRHHYPL